MTKIELMISAGEMSLRLRRGRLVQKWGISWRFCAFWLLAAVSAWVGGTNVSNAAEKEVSSFSQFYSLTPEEAAAGLPVHIRGTVLCFDPGWAQMYLHDGTSCSYVRPQGATNLHRGQYVQLTARTTDNRGKIGWTNLSFSSLGERPLPKAAPLELSQLAQQYGQLVEVVAQVRAAETSRGRLCLTLKDGRAECRAFVLGRMETNRFHNLVGCRVRVRGINTSQVEQGRLVSGLIMANSLDEIRVVEQTEEDYLENPVVSIDALFDRELGSWTNRPVHVNGIITAYVPGEYVIVKDPTGVIRARVSQVTRAAPDERIHLWGFLTISTNEVFLADGFFETLDLSAQSVEPVEPERNSKPSRNKAPLQHIAQVRNLERFEASAHLPVRLRGVVTYVDPDWKTGFLQDPSGAVFFDLTQRDIKPGHLIELTGETDPGGYAPMVTKSSVKVLGATNLPSATPVGLDDLAGGHLDSQWVEMQGVVRRVDGDGLRLFLMLMSPKGTFRAVVSDFTGAVPTSLIDSRVRLRGVCCSEFNDQHQVTGFTLDVPGYQQVEILEAAPDDPFSVQATATRVVGQFRPAAVAGRRVKVSGIVTAVLPGEGFFLQDSAGGIRVRLASPGGVQAGDVVDALGFAGVGDFAPRLEEAFFRVKGRGTLPPARSLTAEEILAQGSEDSVRVQLEAQLLQPVRQSAWPKLIMQSGPIIFAARVVDSSRGKLAALRPGSVLRVTGVCSLKAGDRHQAEALRLVVREPDIEFLSGPPLWTPRNVLASAAAMVVIISIGLAWVAALRRQVRRQTAAIQKEKNLLSTLIDLLPDNVYVKDREGLYVLTNRAHARFHGVASPSEFRGKAGADFFPPEVAREYAEADGKVLAGETSVFTSEEPRANGAGELRFLATTKVPLLDEHGEIQGLVGFSRDVTEAKRSENELREKQRALSTLMSNLPGLAYRSRCDRGRTIEFLSEGCLALTGFSAGELVGRSYEDIVHPEDRQRVWDEIQHAVERKDRFQLMYRIVLRDRQERWVWEQGLGVFSASGELQAFEGFVTDITERRQADQALRVSEERFRAVWEHSIDGMRLTDGEGKIIAVNRAFCQLVKLPREKLIGQLFAVAYSNAEAGGDLETYRKRFHSGKITARATGRIKFQNGEEKDLEVSSCFVDLGQQQRAVLSILRDISERRRVESVLAYERDLLSTLFDNLPDALYFKDLQSRFVRVSRSKLDSSLAMALTRHRFGTKKPAIGQASTELEESLPDHLATREAFGEYIIGKTDFDFFDEARARAAFEDEQQILRSGVPLIGKVEQTNHLDGRVTWSLSTKMPWRDKDGELIGTFGVSKDITSIKEAEARVELAHKQLLEASRQAGMAEVATGVLHNVGNVLNSVNVSANLLSEKLLQSRSSSLAKVAALLREHSANLGHFMATDSRGRQLPMYLEQLADRLAAEQTSLLSEVGCLAKNVEHIKSIVAMQQSYARPAGIQERVEAVELIEDALRINEGALARQGVQVLRQYDPDLPILTVDKHKVLQILVNLVSNAGHACAQSARADKRLTVRLASAGQRLRIAISDNGVGIAPENLVRIFGLGFTTRPDGHGFGLHSGALAAREIGGTLTSHSEGTGLGATFVLELPS